LAGRWAESSRCAGRASIRIESSRLALVATVAALCHEQRLAACDGAGDDSRVSAMSCRVSYRLTMLRFLSLQLQGTDDGRAALSSLRRSFFERGKPSEKVLIQALAVLAAVDLRSELPAIRQRALAIAGDRDRLVPLAAARWLSIVLPTRALLRSSALRTSRSCRIRMSLRRHSTDSSMSAEQPPE
jgi:pimeloyl-ACP methyl ester carboxylesterase